MPAAARSGDLSTGSDGYPATEAVSGFSNNVRINGRFTQLTGITHYGGHGPGYIHSTEGRLVVSGSSKVRINGSAAVRVGDNIADGDTVSTGAGNVFFG